MAIGFCHFANFIVVNYDQRDEIKRVLAIKS